MIGILLRLLSNRNITRTLPGHADDNLGAQGSTNVREPIHDTTTALTVGLFPRGWLIHLNRVRIIPKVVLALENGMTRLVSKPHDALAIQCPGVV